MNKLWKDYSLGFLLAAMWLGSWLLQFVTQLGHEQMEAAQFGQAFNWTEFWWSFFKDTFENWQSEFLQVLTFVAMTKYFIFKGSPESK